MRQAQYSSKVQQPPHTAASSDDRQHTQLAGTTAKRPAAPLVRDEAAAGSNPVRPTRWRRRSAPIWPAITGPVQLQAFAEFYAAAPDDCPRIVLISMGDWQLARGPGRRRLHQGVDGLAEGEPARGGWYLLQSFRERAILF